MGFEFWKEYLPQVDVFQLNHSEAKLFFSHENGEGSSLLELVNAVRKNNMCAVITLDRFGAIGIHRDKPDSVYISWPFLEDKDVRDPTGAGDAFAAGMVAHLCNCKCISANNFQSAMDTACLWAGYACKTYGGAGECPDRKALENFEESVSPRQQRTVEVVNRDFDREIMTMLDTTSQNGYSTI